jgi:hypothetical protein
MPANDDMNTFLRRIEIDIFYVVHDVNSYAVDLRQFRFRNHTSPRSFIVVSTDRDNRRNQLQLFNNLWLTDIAGMKDKPDTRKYLRNLRT